MNHICHICNTYKINHSRHPHPPIFSSTSLASYNLLVITIFWRAHGFVHFGIIKILYGHCPHTLSSSSSNDSLLLLLCHMLISMSIDHSCSENNLFRSHIHPMKKITDINTFSNELETPWFYLFHNAPGPTESNATQNITYKSISRSFNMKFSNYIVAISLLNDLSNL